MCWRPCRRVLEAEAALRATGELLNEGRRTTGALFSATRASLKGTVRGLWPGILRQQEILPDDGNCLFAKHESQNELLLEENKKKNDKQQNISIVFRLQIDLFRIYYSV